MLNSGLIQLEAYSIPTQAGKSSVYRPSTTESEELPDPKSAGSTASHAVWVLCVGVE